MTWWIELSGDDTFAIGTSTSPVSRAGFFTALADDRSLRTALTETLRGSPYAAFAWETPALFAGTADRDAAFAIIDSPSLARVDPDSAPFADALAGCDRIATFANLGRDAVLVVPSPHVAPAAAHLAAFVRTAPAAMIFASSRMARSAAAPRSRGGRGRSPGAGGGPPTPRARDRADRFHCRGRWRGRSIASR